MYRAGYDAGYRIGYEKGYINRAKDVRTAWVAFSHDSNNMFISGVLESLRPTSKGIQYYKDLHKAH
jgi:hypothetical protein